MTINSYGNLVADANAKNSRRGGQHQFFEKKSRDTCCAYLCRALPVAQLTRVYLVHAPLQGSIETPEHCRGLNSRRIPAVTVWSFRLDCTSVKISGLCELRLTHEKLGGRSFLGSPNETRTNSSVTVNSSCHRGMRSPCPSDSARRYHQLHLQHPPCRSRWPRHLHLRCLIRQDMKMFSNLSCT